MKSLPFAAALALAFVFASGCATLPSGIKGEATPHQHGADAEAGHDEAALHGGMAGDAPHEQLGMQRPRFPPASGSVPSAEDAQSLEEVPRLAILNDTKFNPANGVRSGSGTLDDPYVISGYYVTGDLYLGDTDACVVIAENYVDGQLTLNWNNQCVHVHHNFIRDLRVNENIARTGMPTGGLIELNEIVVVGQIRHYDGEFRNNVVGPFVPNDLADEVLHEHPLPFLQVNDPVVLNIDGWNQALFHHNTITGSVDLDLHGHHHGTGFLAPHSHNHGDDQARTTHTEDHTNRWSAVSVTDNKIVDLAGYGLRYDDQAHAGDDRTAASETVEALENDHQHHVKVEILRNELTGAGIWIDVFGADDERHKVPNPGLVTVADNTIKLQKRDDGMFGLSTFGTGFQSNTGIWVMAVKEVEFRIERNTISWSDATQASPVKPISDLLPGLFAQEAEPMAIYLDRADLARITVADNTASGVAYGVRASQFGEDALWAVYGNDFQAQHPIYWDDSVTVEPQEEPFAEPAEPESSEASEHHGK
ncbi:MAG: hypothetical protein AABX89_06705 [Candidatus Thermoplasmatota archaeon]